MVGMSATIGNLSEICQFLNAEVYTKEFRPVELKEFIKCGSEIYEIDRNAISDENRLIPIRTVDCKVCCLFNIIMFRNVCPWVIYFLVSAGDSKNRSGSFSGSSDGGRAKRLVFSVLCVEEKLRKCRETGVPRGVPHAVGTPPSG